MKRIHSIKIYALCAVGCIFLYSVSSCSNLNDKEEILLGKWHEFRCFEFKGGNVSGIAAISVRQTSSDTEFTENKEYSSRGYIKEIIAMMGYEEDGRPSGEVTALADSVLFEEKGTWRIENDSLFKTTKSITFGEKLNNYSHFIWDPFVSPEELKETFAFKYDSEKWKVIKNSIDSMAVKLESFTQDSIKGSVTDKEDMKIKFRGTRINNSYKPETPEMLEDIMARIVFEQED